MKNRKQLQAYVEGAWRDVSMIDYHKGVLMVWQMLTDVYYINDVELRMKEETTMTILKRYKCIKSNDEKKFAVGEIYPLYEGRLNYVVANNNTEWYEDEFQLLEKGYGVLLELIAEHPTPVYTKEDLAQDALETTHTLTHVREAIVKAYQLYDNDSQRLAYLKGYFDK